MSIKRIIIPVAILLFIMHSKAQVNDNPIGELSKRLMQNEMMSQRFFRNFVFIKTNTFKKKALADMDKSLARFDDNMEYFAMHLPADNTEIKEDFDKLNYFWSLYRLSITDYENSDYEKLIRKTKKFGKLMNEFITDMLQAHEDYGKNKKALNIALLDAQNIKDIDNIAASYVLKNAVDAYRDEKVFEVDFDGIAKRLKKIGKFKKTAALTREYVADLHNLLNMIKSTYYKNTYNPRMMFSNISGFSKKSYKILDIILNTIK